MLNAWQERLRKPTQIIVMLFMVLMTFAFLTAGMSQRQLRNASSPQTELDVNEIDSNAAQAVAAVNQDDGLSDLVEEELGEQHRAPARGTRMDSAIMAQDLARIWQAQIESQGLRAAPTADWLTLCRRLSLSLVGTGVSLEEIRSLQSFPEGERFGRHRENLLNSSRFHDYWAERFTRFLVGADEGPFLVYRRRRFRTWLSDQFKINRPYDELVKKLVTAEGIWTDRPEVNFYTVTYDSGDGKPDPIRMAARVSRAFLGVRIDCLQCHDDFLGNVSMGNPDWMGGDHDFRDGQQSDFHQLAAFFTAARAEGLQGIREGDADYEYQYLGREETESVPASVPFRQDLFEEVAPKFGNAPRQQLAEWITHPDNAQFSRAAVVRVWALLFGRPPTDAVDDLPLDEEPSALLSKLTESFPKSDYDLRELIRWVTDSPAFQTDSRADFEITQRHERVGAAFPIVRLRAEQVAGAAIQAGRVKTIDRDSSVLTQLQKFGGTNDFLKGYGDRGEDEFTSDTVTVTQRLIMLNGSMTKEIANYNPVLNASAHVAMFASNDTGLIESLYLANLNRIPTIVEMRHFEERLLNAEKREHVVEDLVWSLLNSSEFAWNH